jgi:Fe2+ transport system protein B
MEHPHEEVTEGQIEKLMEEADQIKIQLEKTNSLSRRFFTAILTGFGTVVGATVLVTLLLYILSFFSHEGILSQYIDKIVEAFQKK